MEVEEKTEKDRGDGGSVCGGGERQWWKMGDFTKSEAERPLSSRGRDGRKGGGGGGAMRGLGRGRTTSTMIRQKIRCTAIGCSQFELLASPVAVRQSLPDLLDTLSLFLALFPLFSFPPISPTTFPSACSATAATAAAAAAAAAATAAAATAISSVEPPSPLSPPSGMGAGEKGRKNFEKKIQFRCHGDRRALTLIKIPRTSHLRFSASSASFSSVSCSVLFILLLRLRLLLLGLLLAGSYPPPRRRRFRSFSDCTHALVLSLPALSFSPSLSFSLSLPLSHSLSVRVHMHKRAIAFTWPVCMYCARASEGTPVDSSANSRYTEGWGREASRGLAVPRFWLTHIKREEVPPDVSLAGLVEWFVCFGHRLSGEKCYLHGREMLPQPKTQADFSSTLALCAKDKCRARPIKARSISKRNVCLSRLPFYRYNEIRETRTSSHRFKVLWLFGVPSDVIRKLYSPRQCFFKPNPTSARPRWINDRELRADACA